MRMIGYVTSGYPSVEGSTETARNYIRGGCDMLEISLPLMNNREAPYLSGLMKQAIAACPDYDAHLEGIRRIRAEFPEADVTILLYNEVAAAIGGEKLANFCKENGIHDVNSPDLHDPDVREALRKNGIREAGLILYVPDEARLLHARNTDGFVYMQAFPREGQELVKGMETPAALIRYIRGNGIKTPIYCGGGIRKAEDVRTLQEAGADGFFLGTSLLMLSDMPEKFVETVKMFKAAIRA